MPFRVMPSGYYIGEHVRKVENLAATFQAVIESSDQTAFQIFLRSVYSYATNNFNKKDIKKAKSVLEKYDLKCVIHASYIYNLCGSADMSTIKGTIKLEKTLASLAVDMDLAVGLENGTEIVVHMGSYKDKEKGIDIAVNSLNTLFSMNSLVTDKVGKLLNISSAEVKKRRRICLENCAGEGSKIWSTLEEAKRIYFYPKLSENVREYGLYFCVDTAHTWGCGIYDFGKKGEVLRFKSDWENTGIPFGKISVLHLNDSLAEYKSFRDLHALIGLGKMFNLTENKKAEKRVKELVKMFKNSIIISEPPSPSDYRSSNFIFQCLIQP